METEKTVELLKPVTFAGVETTEIKLTEPTLGQMIKAAKSGSQMEQLAILIHLNAAIPRAIVDGMGTRDVDACADFFASFNPPLKT